MTYTVAYAPPADDARLKMDDTTRQGFDAAMRGLARDPYGSDSTALDGSGDRREATVAGVFVRYYVSRTVLTVTVVRLVWM